MRAARRFLEGQKGLAEASKPVIVKKGTLLLPTRQEGSVAEGRGQVRSRSVVESEDEGTAAQTMPVTRGKQRCLEAETEARVEVEAKRLASGIAGEEDDGDDNDDNDNDNDNVASGGGGRPGL